VRNHRPECPHLVESAGLELGTLRLSIQSHPIDSDTIAIEWQVASIGLFTIKQLKLPQTPKLILEALNDFVSHAAPARQR
jgi:hypothetical protein